MRRGVSPVITSVLLVLVSIAVVSLLYPWASAAASKVSESIFRDSTLAERRILSNVEMVLPPAENPSAVGQPVLIHNVGLTTLNNVRVWISEKNGTTLIPAAGKYIHNDGNVEDVNFAVTALDGFSPGEALVIWLPPSTNYYGYAVIFASEYYEVSRTIGVLE